MQNALPKDEPNAHQNLDAKFVKIPLINLNAQYRTIQSEIQDAIQSVLESGNFILGTEVDALEKEVSRYVGVSSAVGVASGTDALLLALDALNIGRGDEVILPAFTFFASVGTILQRGAKPVLVDVDPNKYCIDVKRIEENITNKTKAIMPVHLFGHPAEMDLITGIASKYNLNVVEDNAQAIGASYKGRMTGSIGDAGCLSFFPSKNLGAYGDGGMVVTSNNQLAEKIRKLRTHGWSKKYYPEIVGYNSRLDELQAAILRIKLRRLHMWNEARRKLAKRYAEQLHHIDVDLPIESEGAHHVYHLYVIRTPNRDNVATNLAESGVATGVYYPHPIHLVPAMKDFGYHVGDFPVSEKASNQCLALPIYPEMTRIEQDKVASVLEKSINTG